MSYTKQKKSPPGAEKKAKKTHVVSFRLEDEPYRIFKERVKTSGRKQSDFGRRALLNAKVVAIATPEDMAVLRQIGSMANNLNQLAKRANEAGFKMVQWELQRWMERMKFLYNKLSDDWKHN